MKTSNKTHPRILVIDDNAAIQEDFKKILGGQLMASSPLAELEGELFEEPAKPQQRETFRIDCAGQGAEALALVEAAEAAGDPYALAFVDVRMPPGWDGVETIERLWVASPELQAVLCTAYSDYTLRELVERFGQKDNLLILKKPFETVEVLQLAHALTRKWALGRHTRLRVENLEQTAQHRAQELSRETEERARAQSALQSSEARFATAFQSGPMPMAIQSWPEGRFLAVNTSFLELTGCSAEQILQHRAKELNLWENAGALEACLEPDGRVRNYSCTLRRQDGTIRNVVLSTEQLAEESQTCMLLVAQDVTERLKLEAGLRQAQKLEVVGRLVAGVTHEFNNVLTIIQGHAALLHSELAEGGRPTEYTRRILQASQRAAHFTRQLLGISHQRTVHFKAVQLPACVQQVRNMLEQSLAQRHQLSLVLGESLPLIRADECNVEQVLVNLVLNARDAMPSGGAILVGACQVNIPESYAERHNGAKAGSFVCLVVSDKGCGIPRDITNCIFEPFFTTKEVGKGTGLGLSLVRNIAEQHGGWVEVASEVGRGSSFKVFFPVWDGPAPVTEIPEVAPGGLKAGNGQTVLLVEDEPELREMARITLAEGGYRVIEAADGRDALQAWERDCDTIELVVTDMVMPNGVSGSELARTLQNHTPGLPVICTSGYTPEFIEKDIPTGNDTKFLPKPYLPSQLLALIGECLGKRMPKRGLNEVTLTPSFAPA
jgi:two-component system cell cycle sensor histidine kinase/response regulator CckA